uniref:Uncharacterized protein n=1 Tax=Bionectria ochroleuca TaxID=29856 RepID=A0A8H7NPY0_BIOOC
MTTFDSLAERRADFTVDVADPILLQNNAQRFDHSNQNPSAVAAAEVHLTFYLDTMGPKTVESYLFSLGDTLRDECKQLRIKIIGPQSRKEHAPHLYILDINGEGWVNFMKENGVQISPYKLGIRVSFVDFITIWTMSRDWPRFCDKVYKAGCVHRLRAALPALSYDRNQNFGP